MRTVVPLAIAASLLSGCSGAMSQYLNRPIYKDRLHEATENSKILAIGGDYRIARVAIDTTVRREDETTVPRRFYDAQGRPMPTPNLYDVCAETQADAIFTRSADSNLSITDEVLRAGATTSTTDIVTFVDKAIQQAVQTYRRTEVSDAIRHLGSLWCNARMNGDLSATEYRDGLILLTEEAFEALRPNRRDEGGGAQGGAAQAGAQGGQGGAAQSGQSGESGAAQGAQTGPAPGGNSTGTGQGATSRRDGT